MSISGQHSTMNMGIVGMQYEQTSHANNKSCYAAGTYALTCYVGQLLVCHCTMWLHHR